MQWDFNGSKFYVEKELVSSNVTLQKANKELDYFIYSVSHDLRSPLTSILGLAGFIEDETKEPDTREYIAMIKNGINRLDGFIKNILNCSQNNRSGLNIEKNPIGQTISDIVISLRNMSEAEGIEFIIKATDNREF